MSKIWEQLTCEHFYNLCDPQASRALFKKCVEMVEIEVFSFCNRRCWFCPNSKIDRHSQNIFMNPKVYSSIIDHLAEIEYAGKISYSRYNEPLADPVILDRLREAHEKLPHAFLHLNTNGDYLTRDYVEKLYEAGLKSLWVQVYLQNDTHYHEERMFERAHKILTKLDLPYVLETHIKDQRIQFKLDFRDMNLLCYARNFDQDGTDRGGLLDLRAAEYVRTMPCIIPARDLYIDYNGKIVPCCNIRSDAPQHEKYVLGDLTTGQTIFEIYGGQKASAFRRSVLNFKEKQGACRHCHFSHVEKTEDLVKHLDDLQEKAKAVHHSPRS